MIKYDLFMNLPTGSIIKGENQNTHLLQLLKNIYEHKQLGILWNQYLVQRVFKISFKQSDIDRCVFFQGGVILIFYFYDGCFLTPSSKSV